MLSIEALSVCVEEKPPYIGDGGMPTTAEELRDLVSQWPGGPPAELKAEFVAAVSTHAGIPISRLRILMPREDDAEVAQQALAALGAPRRPQPLVMVQSGPDRDNSAMLLPRLVHELDWHVTEVIGVTHLGSTGGTTILDLLSWWVDPRVGATVLVVDQPVFVDTDQVPDRILAVAIRMGNGGQLQVLDWGEGAPTAEADHRLAGAGACGGWPQLHAALGHDGALQPGDRILVCSGSGERQGWCLLQMPATVSGRPAWWRPPLSLRPAPMGVIRA